MHSTRAKAERKQCLGRILGWGSGCDAFHVTTPAPDGAGLIAAMDRAFKRAELRKDAIGVICAHGTGTVSNDAMELAAYDHFFGDAWPPVFSIKGAVGHTLGAAGGMEVAIGLKSLSEQLAPPTVGLSHPEEAARGRVTTQNAHFDGDVLLTCNSGFGGINTALIIQRGGE
jgi:3-oxoacyl-[acyl-carrier-protein] synthase II